MRPRLDKFIFNVLAALALSALLGCDRSEPPVPTTAEQRDTIAPPPDEQRPMYTFAPGLREDYPAVCGFVKEFLETCLVGDYEGYRKLVSRSVNPESKERFQAIYYAIKSVVVETIEPLEVREVPSPAYSVIATVDFHPERKVSLRAGQNRDIAILVFQERGQWRMMPAPAELQPGHKQPTTTSAPTASAPHYPWDEDGDY
jgi:hypothetical protein